MADDVDLWEHLRYDDTVKMAIDEDELAAALALAAAAAKSPPKPRPKPVPKAVPVPDPGPAEQSVDELLAEIEAFAATEDSAEAAPVVDDETESTDDEPDLEPEAQPEDEPEDDESEDDDEPADNVRQIGARAAKADGPDSGEGAVVDPAVVVHDRMRARRIAVRRDEGLRRLRRLAWVLGGLVLLVDGAALAHTPLADVDHVVVQSGAQTSAEAIRAASGLHTGDALLTLDEHGAEDAIEELSWVDRADVQRRWPDTVRISVTERVPAAILQTTGPDLPLALVDATGRVLRIGGPVPPGLVTVTGVPRAMGEGEQLPEEARAALKIALAAPPRAPGAFRSVSTDLEGTLNSGVLVRFGSLDDLDEKLIAVATALARVDMSCADVLDVKVHGNPTVSRRAC